MTLKFIIAEDQGRKKYRGRERKYNLDELMKIIHDEVGLTRTLEISELDNTRSFCETISKKMRDMKIRDLYKLSFSLREKKIFVIRKDTFPKEG